MFIPLPGNASQIVVEAIIKFGWLTMQQLGMVIGMMANPGMYPPSQPHPERLRELVAKLVQAKVLEWDKRMSLVERVPISSTRAKNDVTIVWAAPMTRRAFGLPDHRPGFGKIHLPHRCLANWHLIHLSSALSLDLYRDTVCEFEIVTRTIGSESAYLVNMGGVKAKKPDGFWSINNGKTWSAIEVEAKRKNPEDLIQVALLNRALSVSGDVRQQRVQGMRITHLTVVHGHRGSFSAITNKISKYPPHSESVEDHDPPVPTEHHFIQMEATRWGFRRFMLTNSEQEARDVNREFWGKEKRRKQ